MQIFISIIVFVLGLCFVICLHELGHLSMAKLFKVYCEEYSIGFGPKIVSINPKDKTTGKPLWETTVNIRCIPLGGYVAMVGESDDAALTEAGIPPVPKERTFSGVNHGKQAIIMIAGIVMNVILSFFLCFIADAFCPQQDVYTNRITVASGSYLADSGLTTGTRIVSIKKAYPDDVLIYDGLGNQWTDEKIFNLPDKDKAAIEQSKNRTFNTVDTYFDISNAMLDEVYYRNESGKYYEPVVSVGDSQTHLYLYPSKDSKELTVTITYADMYSTKNDDGSYDGSKVIEVKVKPELIDATKGLYHYEAFGISPYMSYSPKPYNRNSFIDGEGTPTITGQSFVRALGQAFYDQGNGIVQTFQAIGGLFTPSGWQNVGGIVSMFRTTEQAVSIGPFYVFYLWGLISVNIAIMNLIPFPGLDGWQLLLCIIESITRKPANKKFKSYASMIGLGVLLVLGVVLIVLDIIRWVG